MVDSALDTTEPSVKPAGPTDPSPSPSILDPRTFNLHIANQITPATLGNG